MKMGIKDDQLSKYESLKRRVYLIIYPVLFLVDLSYWLFSPFLDPFLEVALPYACLFLLVGTFFFYKKMMFRFWETISLFLFSFYHLFRIHTLSDDLIHGTINVYVMWSSLFFIYVFLVLKRKMAMAYSVAIFAASIIICIPAFQHNRANDTLIQYYITMIMNITFIYFFQGLVSNYMESDMLRKFAFEDPLTRIGNRRLIDSWIEQQMASSLQRNLSFSIIYFDIDHFKKINDQYGHEIGDQVLKEFALEIKRQVEDTDCFFGRWGGEEFIIIAPNRTANEAAKYAELLRQRIIDHTFPHVGSITASFGVANFRLDDEYKTLLSRADHALYLAKENGRNSVVIS